jgi:hypothetical protein
MSFVIEIQGRLRTVYGHSHRRHTLAFLSHVSVKTNFKSEYKSNDRLTNGCTIYRTSSSNHTPHAGSGDVYTGPGETNR